MFMVAAKRSYLVAAFVALLLLFNSACGGGGGSSNPPVNTTPAIQLQVATLNFSDTAGGTAPAAQTFQVQQTNSNASAQTIALASDAAWLAVSPASGTASYGSALAATASVSLTGLTAGTFTGHVTATDAGATGSPATLTVTLTVSAAPPTVENHPDLRRRVIYQIITDRFFNGDAGNDNPAQSSGMFDATKANWQDYWGGDLAGITAKIAYLKAIGVGAIWISPPVDNINTAATYSGTAYAPYHGYSARDFKRIEEHFGDASNSWTAFDALVSAAHAANIQVIVDFAHNDSNPNNAGEYGALYDNGVKLTDYPTDAAASGAAAYYHHNADISNWNDRYQLQYYSLSALADFAQENPGPDKYLKDTLSLFLAHGVDGFRLDAVKHANWGWQYTEANSVESAYTASPNTMAMPPYLFGEWMEGLGDTLFADSAKWSNNSGIAILDYPLYYDVAAAFAGGGSFQTVDSDLTTEAASFANPMDLVTFVDNHDNARLLSKGATTNQLNEALAFTLTCRGIPIVYYGDEQYLHNDTSGGGDPYTRAQMTTFDTTSTAAQLVRYLAALRSANPALAYGSMAQRWKNSDVYIYERQFNDNIVLVAINKSETADQAISGLYTALPAATYTDYLGGMLGGLSLTVTSGGGNNRAANFTLPKHSVSVWQAKGAGAAQAGAISPRLAQPGARVAITGANFGASAGSVKLDGTTASIASWSDDTVLFSVPNITAGAHAVTLTTAGGTTVATPGSFNFTVLEAAQIPVTFTLHGAPALTGTEQYFITGNVVELGNNVTDFAHAFGPLLIPPSGDPLITVPLPAGVGVQLKFIKLASGASSPSAQESATHTYTAPSSGTDAQTITWTP